MTAIQVLTNNLLHAFSQTTIPTDNVDAEYVAVPRRWDIGNITKFALFIGPISSIFDYATYFVMLHVFKAWNNPALFPDRLVRGIPAHRDPHHPYHSHGEDSASGKQGQHTLITTTIVIAAIGIALPFSWLGSFLGFVPLRPAYCIVLALILPSYVILTHVVKTWFIRRFGLS